MKHLTAADRKALIRLASQMPPGSPERKAILAGVTRKNVYRLVYPDPPGSNATGYWDTKTWKGVRSAVATLYRQGRTEGKVYFPQGGFLYFPEVRSSSRMPKPRYGSSRSKKALTAGTVRAFLMVASSKLTQYDKRLEKRQPSLYRLGHFLEALQKVENDVSRFMDEDSPEALEALKRALNRRFDRLPPINNVLKQIDAFLDTGKTPSLTRRASSTWEVQWQQFDRNDRPVSKRKEFRSEAAMNRFMDRKEQADDFYRWQATSSPDGMARRSAREMYEVAVYEGDSLSDVLGPYARMMDAVSSAKKVVRRTRDYAEVRVYEGRGSMRGGGDLVADVSPSGSVSYQIRASETMARRASLDGVRGHKLMPSNVARKIPPIYSQEEVEDPIAHVKLFSPYSNAVWYITEYDPSSKEAFGWADLGMGGGELGYISIRELENIQKGGLPMVERDLYWRPQPLSRAKRSRRASAKPVDRRLQSEITKLINEAVSANPQGFSRDDVRTQSEAYTNLLRGVSRAIRGKDKATAGHNIRQVMLRSNIGLQDPLEHALNLAYFNTFGDNL